MHDYKTKIIVVFPKYQCIVIVHYMLVIIDNDQPSSGSGAEAFVDIRANAPDQFADAAHETSAKPLIGQVSAVGNGAHSVPSEPSSFTECAPEFMGTAILDLDQIANRVLAGNRVIERMTPCPQGADCAGDGGHTRIFDCEEGCGFRGCSVCMEEHEAEPHWSDAATAREMWAKSP